MSRLSKKPVKLEAGIEFKQDEDMLTIKGAKGELKLSILPFIELTHGDGAVTVSTKSRTKQARMNVGTMWSLITNACRGVSEGFSKSLVIHGVGYRAALEGATLVLNVGFAHPVRFDPMSGVTIAVEKNAITVSGINKQLVGQTAAKIRAFKKPEPYKGKGIAYKDEVIRRKAGKRAASTSA